MNIGNICQILNTISKHKFRYSCSTYQPTNGSNSKDIITGIYTYIKSSGNYYQAPVFTTDTPQRPFDFQSYDITIPQTPAIQRSI